MCSASKGYCSKISYNILKNFFPFPFKKKVSKVETFDDSGLVLYSKRKTLKKKMTKPGWPTMCHGELIVCRLFPST